MNRFGAVAVAIVIFNYSGAIRIQFARVGMMYRKFLQRVAVDVAVVAAAAAAIVALTGEFLFYYIMLLHRQSIDICSFTFQSSVFLLDIHIPLHF